jgi:hypothetical protein
MRLKVVMQNKRFYTLVIFSMYHISNEKNGLLATQTLSDTAL